MPDSAVTEASADAVWAGMEFGDVTSGEVVLGGVVGSTAYGLATPASDVDRLGVFVAPTRQVLSLTGVPHVSVSRSCPDVTVHEVGKFASLCLKANPTLLEVLWLPGYEVCTPLGGELVRARPWFLSTGAVRAAYGGYARAQAARALVRAEAGREGFSSSLRSRTAKHARHCVRLILSGEALLRTGELVVDVSARREEVFAAGDVAVSDPEGFSRLVGELLRGFDSARSVLPESPDVGRVQDLVVSLRLAELDSHPPTSCGLPVP